MKSGRFEYDGRDRRIRGKVARNGFSFAGWSLNGSSEIVVREMNGVVPNSFIKRNAGKKVVLKAVWRRNGAAAGAVSKKTVLKAERSPSSPGDDRGEREACPGGDCGSRIYIREIEEGGLFAALWAACEELKKEQTNRDTAENAPDQEWPAGKKKSLGCMVSLEKIPVDQHVVEILEYCKENPYEVSSRGSYLVILPEEAEADSIDLVEIGEITDGRDRVVLYNEKRRFLTPPQRQAKDIAARRRL